MVKCLNLQGWTSKIYDFVKLDGCRRSRSFAETTDLKPEGLSFVSEAYVSLCKCKPDKSIILQILWIRDDRFLLRSRLLFRLSGQACVSRNEK